MLKLVTNIYKNISTDEKIKLYLKFCEYLAKEQMQRERSQCIPKGNETNEKGGKENKGN